MPRRCLALASLLIGLVAPTGRALAAHDLVEPRACLAGDWGRSHRREWRIQFGVFDDPAHAEARERSLHAHGLSAETYLAAWLARDDREPRVVVSAPYPSRALAERAARRYRSGHGEALVRQFVVWRR